jgi:radical SAM superfamily enzyme YgiQ (UPF0313 family)
MHVLLVGAELEENLALRYLASAVKGAGHTFELAAFDHPRQTADVVAAAKARPPALIGLAATFQYRAREFGALAQALRDAGCTAHITAGGHFPTFAFRELLVACPAIDSVVRHEGEETLPELCAALAKGGGLAALAAVDGIAFRGESGVVATPARPLVKDLDLLPFPERVGPPQLHLGVPAAFLVGTRGCHGHCTFCCIHAYLRSAGGPMYRLRSPENVADEMAELRRTRGVRMFVFHDDDFFTRDQPRDLARVTALRDALRARGVRDVAIVVKARPDDLDPALLAVLEDIGLLRVYLGVESGCSEGLRVLGRGVDLEQNRRALALLRERDVYTCFNMLVFDPESRIDTLRASFGFLREHASVPMNFCRTEIYVGTPLMTKLAAEGRLIGDVFGWDYHLRDPRADRAFRVFASAFHDRNFRCDGLMNSTLGLGYHLHLVRQFYPSAMTPRLRELSDEVTRRVNLDCNDRMQAILDFAAGSASDDAGALADFTAKATDEVTRSNRSLEADVAWATDEMARAVVSPRRARPAQSMPRWKALSAAAVALVPMACEKTPAYPPPDPLPMPTLSGEPPPPPPDPLPMPVMYDAGAAPQGPMTIDPLPMPMTHDAGVAKPPHTVPMPHDWVPRPHRGDAAAPLPPPDPPPPPHLKK